MWEWLSLGLPCQYESWRRIPSLLSEQIRWSTIVLRTCYVASLTLYLPLSQSNILTLLRSKLFTSFNPGPAKDFDSCSCPSRVAPSQYLDKKAQDDAIDISVPVNQDMIQCQDKSMPACGGNPWSFCKMCRAYLCVKAIANGEKWLSHIVKEHEID